MAPRARASDSRADLAAEMGSDMCPPRQLPRLSQLAAVRDEGCQAPRVEQSSLDLAPNELDRAVPGADQGRSPDDRRLARFERSRESRRPLRFEHGQHRAAN